MWGEKLLRRYIKWSEKRTARQLGLEEVDPEFKSRLSRARESLEVHGSSSWEFIETVGNLLVEVLGENERVEFYCRDERTEIYSKIAFKAFAPTEQGQVYILQSGIVVSPQSQAEETRFLYGDPVALIQEVPNLFTRIKGGNHPSFSRGEPSIVNANYGFPEAVADLCVLVKSIEGAQYQKIIPFDLS